MKREIKSKVFLFILFTIILISSKGFSQDLINTYKQYLPQKYLNNPELREQLSRLLESKSRIQPDLLYYYITYYNMLSGSTTAAEKADCNNFKRLISSIENDFIIKRNFWIAEQISIVDTMKIELLVKDRIKDKFRELLLDESSEPKPDYPEFKIDQNQVDYYSVLYYAPDSFSKYLPNINYKSLKEKEENKAREEVRKLYNTSKETQSKNEAEMTSFLLNRWYILDNYDSHPAEIIASLSIREHNVKRQPNLIFGIGYAPYSQGCNINPSIFIKGLEDNYNFEIKSPMRQAGLTLGYKYYLRDVVGFLSYINAQLLYFYSFPSGSEIDPPGFSKTYESSTMAYQEDLIFKKSVMTPLSGQSFFVNASFPVYINLGVVNIEAGLLAGISKVKYKYEYNYYYTKTERNITAGSYNRLIAKGTGADEYESSYQKIVVSPTLGISVFPLNYITANVNFNTQYISVFLLYGF